jgi:sugar phosphate isomerase/epimerase
LRSALTPGKLLSRFENQTLHDMRRRREEFEMGDLNNGQSLIDELEAAGLVGMTGAVWARVQGDRTAVYDPDGTAHSFAKVNANANKLVRLFRSRGIKAGDSIAVVCSNRVEFIEALQASRRAGLRFTPVNWHLTTDEIAYIIQDCEARIVVGEARVAQRAEAEPATGCHGGRQGKRRRGGRGSEPARRRKKNI